MCFIIVQIDVTDKAGVGFFNLWGWPVSRQKNCVGDFNSFGGEIWFTSALCQVGEIVGGGNFPSYFIGAVMESVERVLVTIIGVNHCSSGVNDGLMLLVESVSGRISIWS